MKIAICDDESVCREQAVAAANAYIRQRTDRKITLSVFSHPEDLLESAQKIGGYDIYILDIVMPHINGIQLGVKLRDAGYDGKIIYLTSSDEYALDSFRVRAFDYIIKPVNPDVFTKTMDEVLQSIDVRKEKHIIVKTRSGAVKVYFDRILYVELSKRALLFHLRGGKTVESVYLRTTFAEAVAELIADKRFAQCGASMLVNLTHIHNMDSDSVSFDDSEKLHLSAKNSRELRGVWNDYLFNIEEA